jgi:hypothetical protein
MIPKTGFAPRIDQAATFDLGGRRLLEKIMLQHKGKAARRSSDDRPVPEKNPSIPDAAAA